MTRRNFNWFSFAVTLAMLAICSDLQAQRQPFQIGRIFSAGGGQGVRIGGPNFGMQFGGGQGAVFGSPTRGMHFGGGRGAHFGGPNFGMQFGGGHGTQIGRLDGAYPARPWPGTGQTYGQPTYSQPGVNVQPSVQPNASPTTASQQGFSGQSNSYANQMYGSGETQPNLTNAEPTPADLSAAQPTVAPQQETAATETVKGTRSVLDQTPNPNAEMIRVFYPKTAKQALNYSLNGSMFTVAPGHSFMLKSQQAWVIGFSPADSADEIKYSLAKPGQYIFEETDGRWDLIRVEGSNN